VRRNHPERATAPGRQRPPHRLQAYPQEAERARVAAPAFTRDALKTISGLEEFLLLHAVLPEP